MAVPGLADVFAARRRISGHVDATPLRASQWLSAVAGVPVLLKLENVQRTGAFKIRGAVNALARRERTAQVVTASAGNHGRAVALAARKLGIRVTVFAPADAPRTKLNAMLALGADLRREANYDAAEAAARAYSEETGLAFVSPYNDADVIAGAGTIALELFDAEPTIETIVVPVGGGGLLAGTAIAAKAISPRVRLIGVEAAASCAMSASLSAGHITTIEPRPTLADGLAGNLEPGSMTFEIARRYVDDMVTVTERDIGRAMAGLIREEHLVAEGAGVVGISALLAARVAPRGRTVVLVTGANVDASRLAAVLRDHEDE